jgi:hypothetical protein
MAGETNPGRNMWVGFGLQTSMTTVATIYDYFQPTEVGGFLEEFATIESGRRLGTRFSGLPYLGTKQVPFSFTIEATPNIGRIIMAGLGVNSIVSVTSAAWNHDFRFAEVLPYATILAHAAGTADGTSVHQEIRIIGAKVSKLTFAGSIDNVFTLAVEGMGMTMSAAASVTASYTPWDPFFLNSAQGTATLSIGTTITLVTSFEEARDFELVIDNAVSADHRIHGTAVPVGMSEGDSGVTGKFTAIFNDNTFLEINKFAAGTKRALSLSAVGTQPVPTLPTIMHAFAVGLPVIRYTGDTPSFDPDVMTVDMPFKAQIDTLSTFITIVNDKSTIYSSAL